MVLTINRKCATCVEMDFHIFEGRQTTTMKRLNLLLIVFYLAAMATAVAQESANTDFDAYEKLVAEAKEHRKTRQLTFDEFLAKSKEEGVIVLDARSDAMFKAKHLKGATHLDFTDFNERKLKEVLGNKDRTVLIYCNNNISQDEDYFARKEVARPNSYSLSGKPNPRTPVSLALNITTYIHLYAYCYRNVYELSESISAFDKRAEFEGTEVKGSIPEKERIEFLKQKALQQAEEEKQQKR